MRYLEAFCILVIVTMIMHCLLFLYSSLNSCQAPSNHFSCRSVSKNTSTINSSLHLFLSCLFSSSFLLFFLHPLIPRAVQILNLDLSDQVCSFRSPRSQNPTTSSRPSIPFFLPIHGPTDRSNQTSLIKPT